MTVYRDDEGLRYRREGDVVVYLDSPAAAPNTRMSVAPAPPPELESDLLAALRTGAWLDAQNFPPLRYAVPNIVPEGSTLLVGPPKVGKSWFVLGVALGVASGGRVLGQVPVERRPVLYLALEDGHRRLQDRCRTLLGPDEPIPEMFEYMTTVVPCTALVTIAEWLQLHPGEEPLVILDTLGKVMPPALMGESSYQRDYRVGSALKRLADDHPGSSLLTNHHDRKASSDDFVDSVSGTHGLAGSADTIVVLNRARHETDGVLKVTGRDVAEGEYAVKFDAEALWQLDGDTFEAAAARAGQRRATAGVGSVMTDVIDHVVTNPAGVTPTAVATALDLDGATVRKYLTRAVEKGRLRRVGRGLYTPVTSVPLSRTDDSERDNATDVTPLLGDELASDDSRGMWR